MRIGVSLTSSINVDKKYIELTEKLAIKLAKNNDGVVFGGTNYGMMSKLADTYLEYGGSTLIGVMAKDLMRVTENYQAHRGLTSSFVLETMELRKKKIFELSEGFILLPGGYGTLEEIISIIGMKANLISDIPIVLFNYDNFYSSLLNFLDEMVSKKFSKIPVREILYVTDRLNDCLDYLHNYGGSQLPQKFK